MPQNPTWSLEEDLEWSLNHVGLKVYYSFNYQYYLEYLLFLIPLVFLFYRIVKIHFRCESRRKQPLIEGVIVLQVDSQRKWILTIL